MKRCLYCKKIKWPWQEHYPCDSSFAHWSCGEAAMKERLRKVYVETGMEYLLKKPFLTEPD